MFKIPKNDSKYHWTQHAIRKMGFYGLSPDRVRRVIRNSTRVEDGIAENTIAVMTPDTNKKKPSEIWVMYASHGGEAVLWGQKKGNKKIIVSAWRYPGVSPIGKQIPIPQDILEELKNEGILEK